VTAPAALKPGRGQPWVKSLRGLATWPGALALGKLADLGFRGAPI
jgi:hypothetical protein